jgi:transmembrane sensor
MIGAETSSARDIRLSAAAWLERHDCADWRKEDQAELEAWLSQSPSHRVAYLRASSAWKRADRLSALRSSAPEPDVAKKRISFGFARVAIALTMVGVIGVAAMGYSLKPNIKSYATRVGGRQTLALADGSKVEMNTDTALRVQIDAGKRIIWLDRGEAYFKVRHDAAHSFVVMAGGHRVTDLGTEFLVRRNAANLEVMLITGRARLDANTNARSALLKPGDLAIATARTMSVTHKAADELASDLGWRNGVLIFKHTTLADAAAEFNRYNAIKLVVADSSVAKLQIGGTFPTGNVELFGHIAQIILGVRAQKRGDEIVISR